MRAAGLTFLVLGLLSAAPARGGSLHSLRRRRDAAELQEGLSLAELSRLQRGSANRQHLALGQQVTAPQLSHPPRLPECLPSANVSAALAASIQQRFSAQLASPNVTVETRHVQRAGECSYQSDIFYWATNASIGGQLAAAADAGELCKALPDYCEATFPAGGGYRLIFSDGDAQADLPPALDFNCTRSTLQQALDHFNSTEKRTFSQVYWVCDAAWPAAAAEQEASGHVIVFLGNESPLGVPRQPIVFEHARRLNALVLLVEHRYYGDSVPFKPAADNDGTPADNGAHKLATEQYRWLQIEQVIEDSAKALTAVRAQYRVPAAVPALVIGGSYGGMLSTYHRVVRPDAFAAAIASSAPVQYVLGTRMWARSSDRYHRFIAASADAMSGQRACHRAVRAGLETVLALSRSADGRARLARAFQLCGESPEAALPGEHAGFVLMLDQLGAYEGYAQVNNQPPLYGQMELACSLIASSLQRRPGDHVAALAAANTYFNHNGSAAWCYSTGFNASDAQQGLYVDRSAYGYQCCTQGVVDSFELPSAGGRADLAPRLRVLPADVAADCARVFGPSLPPLAPPSFAARVQGLLLRVGGVVFTNGQLDGWAGGSLLSYDDLWEGVGDDDASDGGGGVGGARSRRAMQQQYGSGGAGGPLAFIQPYPNASHCTDTHTATWDMPGAPPEWAVLRGHAVDAAAAFAAAWRRERRQQAEAW